jgi:hypothetical protein
MRLRDGTRRPRSGMYHSRFHPEFSIDSPPPTPFHFYHFLSLIVAYITLLHLFLAIEPFSSSVRGCGQPSCSLRLDAAFEFHVSIDASTRAIYTF